MAVLNPVAFDLIFKSKNVYNKKVSRYFFVIENKITEDNFKE